MDSKPVGGVRLPIRSLSSDILKSTEPEPGTKIQHIENAPDLDLPEAADLKSANDVNTPATFEHKAHLPLGISETEDEEKSHWYIGSIDCGTTSSRFLIFDGTGTPIASHQIEFQNIYPESG